MASEDIEIRVWQSAEGLDASVQCPSFVARVGDQSDRARVRSVHLRGRLT